MLEFDRETNLRIKAMEMALDLHKSSIHPYIAPDMSPGPDSELFSFKDFVAFAIKDAKKIYEFLFDDRDK